MLKSLRKLMFLSVMVLALVAPTKAVAGPEQIAIDLGASLIRSLFGPSQNPQEVKIQQFEAKLISNVKKDLAKAGFKVGDVKWDGMIKFSDEIHVAYFSVVMNQKDGCYFYLLERGKALNGNEPEDMKDYKAFLQMPVAEKRNFLRTSFEKYANFKIPDDAESVPAEPRRDYQVDAPSQKMPNIPTTGFAPGKLPR